MWTFWRTTARDRELAAVQDYFLETSAFRRVLYSERLRVDRRGGSFTVLIFGFAAEMKFPPPKFTDVLEGRLRGTDLAAIWSACQVAVLLPDTDEDGARIVLRDLAAKFPIEARPREVSLHAYPSDDPFVDDPSGDSAPDRAESDRVSAEPGASAEGTQAVPEAPFELGRVHPAERLFAQSLPAWKRGFDIVGGAVGLLLSLPVLLVSALLIRWTSPGPILFAQRRAGLGGRPFTMYKLRTMHNNAEEAKAALEHLNECDGAAFKLADDPRVTTVGRFLRRTCIDEIPQFWNVLRGEMSLVGPRPLPCEEARRCGRWQRRRVDVTPGLTCIWQVRGMHRVSFVEWMKMDLEYIRRRRFWLDVQLLVSTVVAVLTRRASH